MADFLINVRSHWDSAGVRAYADEVEKAIQRIKSAADSGAPGWALGGSVQGTVQGEQARMEANLSSLKSVIPASEYDALATSQRAAMAAVAKAAGVDLLAGKERDRAATAVRDEWIKAAAADKSAAEAHTNAARVATQASAAHGVGTGIGTATDIDRANELTIAASNRNLDLARAAARTSAAPANTRATLPLGDGSYAEFDVAAAEVNPIKAAKLAALRESNRLTLRAVQMEELGLVELADETKEQNDIRIALARRAANARKSQALSEAILANEDGILDAQVQTLLAQRAVAREKLAQAKAEEKAQGIGGGGGGGDGPVGFIANIGNKLAAASQLAFTAAIILPVIQNVRGLVTEAERGQIAFASLRTQMEAVGQANRFPEVQKDILEMARDAGLATDVVAGVAQTMLGAFNDVDKGISAVREGLTAMQVGGLNADQVKNLFVSIPSAFNLTSDQIAGINDELLHLRDTFGTSVKEVAAGVGSIAPLAAAIGLSFKETAAIVAAAGQASGKSTEQAASDIGRALTQIEKKGLPILQLFQNSTNAAVRERAPAVQEDLRSGQSGQAFIEIIKNWNNLGSSIQETEEIQAKFYQLIGGKREFASLAAALGLSAKLTKELDDNESHAGRSATELANYHKTLSFQILAAKEAFRQMGIALIQSGLGDVLVDLVKYGAEFLGVVGKLLGLIASANEATHGWAIRALELYAAFRLIKGLGSIGAGVLDGLGNVGVRSVFGGPGGGGVRGLVGGGIGGFLQSRGVAYGLEKSAAEGVVGIGGRTLGPISTTASGGLAALGITPLVAGVIAAGAVAASYSAQKSKVQGAYKAYEERVKALDEKALAEIASNKSSFMDKVAFSIFGEKSPEEVAKEELGKRKQQAREKPLDLQIRGARDAGLITGSDADFNDLVNKARAGDKDAVDKIQRLLDNIAASTPQNKTRLDVGVQNVLNADAVKAAVSRVVSDETAQTVAEAKRLWDAGLSTASDYVAAVASAMKDLQLAADSTDPNTDDGKKARKALNDAKATQAQEASDAARSLADYNSQQDALSGKDANASKVDRLTALINSGVLTPKDQVKAANDIIAAELALNADQAAAADGAIEAYKIIHAGAKIPDNARSAILTSVINSDLQLVPFFDLLAQAGVTAIDETTSLVERALKGEGDVKKLLASDLRKQAAALRLAVTGSATGLFEGGDADANELYNKLISRADTIDKTVTDIKTPGSVAHVDPKTDAEAKKAAVAKAHSDAEAEAKARLALRKAQLEGDPVGQAQVAIEEANYAYSIASTSAEKLTAQAQLVTAQHALNQAEVTVADAYRNLDVALAQAAGDSVRVAELEVSAAQAHLIAARNRGDKLGELAAQAEVIAGQANVTASTIATGERNTDFLLQMEQITTQQALAQLTALLQVPGITAEQTQQLLLKINSLRKSVSQNLQFDIPSDIKLPTLYEVRRAAGSIAQGTGYNDNRQININVTANNMSDMDAIATTFATQFAAGSTYGAGTRRY